MTKLKTRFNSSQKEQVMTGDTRKLHFKKDSSECTVVAEDNPLGNKFGTTAVQKEKISVVLNAVDLDVSLRKQ